MRPTAFRRCSLPSRSATSAIERPAATRRSRLDLDDDLADVAALDRHVGNVGDAADRAAADRSRRSRAAPTESRPPVTTNEMMGKIEGVCRSTIVLVPAGSWEPTSAMPRPHVVEGLDHVGAGDEVDVDLGRPADRLRAHALHAQHDADRLLDRPGDGDLDVLDRQARRLHDHRRSAERPPRDRCRWACAASQ